MTETDLKRALIKSIQAQGGVGSRFEDQFSAGFPDCLFIPECGPVFFAEVKLIQSGRKLVCTPRQEIQLDRLHRPQRNGAWFSHGVLIGYHFKREALYIGRPGDLIDHARFVPRPRRLDSADWGITHLLIKFDLDRPAAQPPFRSDADARSCL